VLENFEIIKLFGYLDYSIDVVDNKVILVGENGSGKSTVVSMLYYFLTKQWKKLKEFEFLEMSVKINGNKLKITKNEIMTMPRARSHNIVMYISNKLRANNITPEDASKNPMEIYRKIFSSEPRVSPSTYRQIIEELCHQESQLFIDYSDNISAIEKALDLRILYLPTYRRIERDFKTIFPALEEDIDRYNRKVTKSDVEKKHIELVEFGMEDVFLLINAKMNSLNNEFRSSLYALTGGYLRVVLRKEYKKADVNVLKKIDVKTLDSILGRIDDTILSSEDRKTLTKTISTLQRKKTANEIDLISAHIISQLIILHEKQYEREKSVRTFANVCNTYLRNKGFYFDSNHFTLPIRPITMLKNNVRVFNKGEILLSMLSSGEKQIVSLFAHLYLSDHSDHLIIIDEPELSLSVPWQKAFLPDILRSDRCNGLIAVTHSPFIYENELADKAHSIQEFSL
jgi:predicted ATPase